jgi:predicted AAA+ superfamily ATPase
VRPLFETWAHAELFKATSLEAPPPELLFWRTRTNQVVDFLIERGGEIVGIEVRWVRSRR